jgi:hypothetical protein
MSYDGDTGVTRAFLQCMDYRDLLRRLKETKHPARHPMLLPILIAELVIKLSSTQMHWHQTMITEGIEVSTGQNAYSFEEKVNRLTIKHRDLIKQTNVLITNLVWTEMKLKSLSLFYDRLGNSTPNYWSHIEDLLPANRGDQVKEAAEALQGMIEHQQSVTDNLLLSAQNVRERAQSQLSMVRGPSEIHLTTVTRVL